MNYNLKRHKLLKILSNQYVKFDSLDEANSDKLAVDYNEIYKALNCNSYRLRFIISPLMDEKEIDSFNNGYEGLFAYEKGLSAFTDKKYFRKFINSILNKIKDFVHIVIPVFSLFIAYIALTGNFKAGNVEQDILLQEMQHKIELLQSKVEQLEIESKTNNQNDTLKIE